VNNAPADAKAKLEIIDGAGRVVRELPANAKAGMYRPVWDMRVGAPLTGVATAAPAGGRGQGGGGGFGGGFGGGRFRQWHRAP
jgi:hypothetical protein